MYGHHYTPQTMSMTKVLTEEVNAFKSRALNDKYVFYGRYLHSTKTSNRIQRSDLYCHIREDGTKEVLRCDCSN